MKTLEFIVDEAAHCLVASEASRIRQLQADLTTQPTGCLGLPNQLAQEYVQSRDRSTLGRIFRIANRSIDHLDAVVILGSPADCLACRIATDALCDPFHNELSRAQRGSKPRIYYLDCTLDNDACDAVLRRLETDAASDDQADRRFAIVSVEGSAQQESIVWIRDVLADRLRIRLGDQTDAWLPHMVTRVVSNTETLSRDPSSALNKQDLRQPVCRDGQIAACQSFVRPSNSIGLRGVLTPATLLPAAYLGLDCMKLAEGALKMNHRVSLCRPDSDPSLWHWLQLHTTAPIQLKCWDQSLTAFARWVDHLQAEHPLLPTESRDRVSMLNVQHPRSDLIQSTQGDSLISQRQARIDRWKTDLQTKQTVIDEIAVPVIDAFTLGQLIQLFLIVHHSS